MNCRRHRGWRVVALHTALLLGVVGPGCTTAPQPGRDLPFYDSPDFTPRWTRAVSHRIAPFALTTQTGDTLRDTDLQGRVHVASFLFTRCTDVCPRMVQQLSKVQTAIGQADDVRLVSYSVTPDLDTPAVLATFGRQHGIDPARWALLTGPAGAIYDLARTSYFADDPRPVPSTSGAPQFLHTEKVLLVDGEGHLRGVYNGTLPFDIEKLLTDLATLRAETRRARRS